MAAKKKSAPSAKPPVGSGGAKKKTKGYLDQGARSALKNVDWQGVGRIMRDENTKRRVKRQSVASRGSEGPKRSKKVYLDDRSDRRGGKGF